MKISFSFYKRALSAVMLAAVLLISGCDGARSVNPSGGLFSTKHGGSDAPGGSQSGAADIDLTNIYIDLSRDVRNECQMQFDDGLLTITGKIGDQGVTDVVTDFPADVKFKRSGDRFTCTITYTSSRSSYGMIEIVNRKYQNTSVRVKISQGAISLPNVIGNAQSNYDMAQSDIPKNSAAVTLMNITTSGDKKRAAEVLDEVKALSNKICSGLTNDYDKLRAISRWVSNNIYYDHPAYAAGIPAKCLSLEYILENRSGVCGSYANMTAALCQAQGILCYNVIGEGISSVNRCYAEQSAGSAHEWNYAFVGGRGIWVDSGWNSFNHTYGGNETVSGDIGCKYFDIGNEVLALNHKVHNLCNRDFFDPDILV